MAQKHNISDTEYPMTRMGTIQQPSRRYRRLRHPSFTAAVWTANNPLLQRGEFGSEIDTGKLKVGDGVTYWNDLGYVAASQIDFADITGSPDDNVALKGALDGKVSKSGDSMSGDLTMEYQNKVAFDNSGATYKQYISADSSNDLIFGTTASSSVKFDMNMSAGVFSTTYSSGTLGNTSRKWANTFTTKINNGADISVPTSGGTMALTSDIKDATITIKAGNTTADSFTLNQSSNKDITIPANVASWSSNVSNCITEIPQDINVELSSGTLTLKSGSKITAPDGTQATTTADKTGTLSADGQYFIFGDKNNGALQLSSNYTIAKTGSGSSLPADGSIYTVYFNTTDSKIYRWNGSAWIEWGVTLPLGIITVSSGAISSIDQVFNGFGYIGSTAFALPGVKGLIPNGRNADGSLKNNTMTVQNVLTRTIPSNTGWHYLSINASGTGCDFRTNYFQGASNPSSAPQFSVFYNYVDNLSYLQGTVGVWTPQNNFVCPFRIEHESSSPYKITSIKPASVFHAVDYNDTEFIAHQATPSDKYIDLTLPTSGNVLTAPADGYFAVGKNSTASGQRLRMWYRGTNAGDLMAASTWSFGTENLEISLYVTKGSAVAFIYSADGVTNYCRFIYANGAK